MAPIHKDLNILFPNSNSSYNKGSVRISENDDKAKVKEIFWINSNFHYIDNSLIKNIKGFFNSCGSSSILCLDCDGIIIFQHNYKKYIYLSELKSTFATENIFHAKDQLISSYVKINMILNLLPNYNKKDYIFKAFIFSLSPDKDYLIELRRELMMSPNIGNYLTRSIFTDELCSQKPNKYILKPTNCMKLKGLPLGSNCLFNELEINYISIPSGSTSIKIDVTKFI